MMKHRNIEILGWFGVALIISPYALGIFGLLSANSLPYMIMNLLGGVAIIIEAGSKKDYQPLTLNVVWAIIALIGIIRFFF